jgi:transposase
MDTKQEIIRRYYRENDSERKISRDLQISRKTVKKYLLEYQRVRTISIEENDTEKLQDYSNEPPAYKSEKRTKRKLICEIEDLIKEQLTENERKKKEGLRKQIKRKIDIHEYILSKGYQIGYTTVCNYIREDKLTTREAFIKQVYLPGEECEFDWAEVKLNIGGGLSRLYMAVFTSSYSNYRYSDLYKRQDTLAFMESHNDFKTHIGGVFHEMVYDNMRVAVAEFAGRNEKTPTQALVSLSGWFQFRWRFCNVRRGNEKGHVERSVEVIRRKAFSHVDTFDTLEQARKHLREVCNKLNNTPGSTTNNTPMALLEKERPHLWQNPGPISCFVTHALKVDKYATICFGTNHYSVPDYLTGRMIDVKVYSNKLKMYYQNEQVGQHERDYGMHHWQIKLNHYLRTLSIKPNALHGSLALEQAPEGLQKLYKSHFVNSPRGFIEILQYCQSKKIPWEKIAETVGELARLCPKDVSTEKVIALLGNQGMSPILTSKAITGEIESFAHEQLKQISNLVDNLKN